MANNVHVHAGDSRCVCKGFHIGQLVTSHSLDMGPLHTQLDGDSHFVGRIHAEQQ